MDIPLTSFNNSASISDDAVSNLDSVEEMAIAVYHQVYELTGCEMRAKDAYFEVFTSLNI